MEFIKQDDPRAKEIVELKEKIMDKLMELMQEKNVSADVLFNSLVSVLVPMAAMVANGNKTELEHIANELRYSIIGQLDNLTK